MIKSQPTMSKQARHRNIVCGDSLVKNVDSWRLKPKCNINEEIVIQCFPRATVKGMRSCIGPSIDRKPDTIILHCRTNDLRLKDKMEVEISKEIIDIAKQIQSKKLILSCPASLPDEMNLGTNERKQTMS